MGQNTLKFKEIAEKWLSDKALDNKTTTKSRYRTILDKHLYPVFENKNIDDISEDEIRSFLKEKSDKYKYNTVYGIMVVLKSIMEGEFEREEYKRVRRIRSSCFHLNRTKNHIETLTEKEARKFNKNLMLSDKLTDIGILLALNTGLRIGEICALKWSDVDFVLNALRVSGTVQRVYENNGKNTTKVAYLPPKTPDSERIVPLSSEIIQKLRKIKQDENIFILTGNTHPMEPRGLQLHFKKRSEDILKRHIKFHDLRHTFATLSISGGADIKAISEILGHKDISTTLSIYRAVSFDDKRKALKKLSKTLGF